MKHVLFFWILSSFLISCSSSPASTEAPEKPEQMIIGRWKLQAHESKMTEKKEVDLKRQPTQVILSIADGGYFIVYDTFTDPRFDQKGFSRISERSKGQWELSSDKKLILRHNLDDTTIVEELNIEVLNKNTLVTKGKDKKSAIYKTYQGY